MASEEQKKRKRKKIETSLYMYVICVMLSDSDQIRPDQEGWRNAYEGKRHLLLLLLLLFERLQHKTHIRKYNSQNCIFRIYGRWCSLCFSFHPSIYLTVCVYAREGPFFPFYFFFFVNRVYSVKEIKKEKKKKMQKESERESAHDASQPALGSQSN